MDKITLQLVNYEGLDILTDRNYKKSKNVFYRWGAFTQSGRINSEGEPEELIPNGLNELVPDMRAPHFILPEGIIDPFSSLPTSSAPSVSSNSMKFKQYEIDSVLRFSNAGGRYKAICEKTGLDVVLKEARPKTGFVGEENAVTRLTKESETLKKLNAELPGLAPELLDEFDVKGHKFLVIKYINGTPLSEWIARENPLYSSAHSSKDLVDEYLNRAKFIIYTIEKLLRKLHASGIAFGDLSPGNVIIDSQDEPHLIDFEACLPIDTLSTGVGTPDFCLLEQGGQLTAQARDVYALKCIAISFVLRVTTLAEISNQVLDILSEELMRYCSSLPRWWINACNHVNAVTRKHSIYNVSYFSQPKFSNNRSTKVVRGDLFSGVLRHRSINEKQIFPTSNKSLKGAHLSFFYGDSGVLYTLKKHGKKIDENLIEKYTCSVDDALKQDLLPLGYEAGLAGVLDVCETLNLKETSKNVLEKIIKDWESLEDPTLSNGLAGIATILNKYKYYDLAKKVFEKALNLESTFSWRKNGLLYGRSGLVVAAAELSSSIDLNISIKKYISFELEQTVRHPLGNAISLKGEIDGNRLLPYLRDGTAGLLLALVAAHECEHLDYELDQELLQNLTMDLYTPFMLEASLMDGVAGIQVVLELIRNKFPDLKKSFTDTKRYRLSKYILPSVSGLGLFNPRTYKYDFSYSQGSLGVIEALKYLEGNYALSIIGISIDPISAKE
ncbi:MAG: hypothetical protein RLO81_06520 [Fulvivirga sp.]|uniref:class III lanthionine synthetase LanKC N-terminal domain-containing protein n=1 Tax=Fulvivirga sp. TaxID=1931237 RepID=UPI0032EF34A3